MNRDEAIKYAKENILAYTSEMAEFKALAIEALERQIPKKPIKYDIDYFGNTLFRCPVCGDSWNSNEFADGMECCWTCGQALDWSEERGE